MIYRIHPRIYEFRIPYFDENELQKVSGGYQSFYIDTGIREYARYWPKEPVEVRFTFTSRKKNKRVPDIIEDCGRLFLNARAYSVLQGVLEPCGEFLPVQYEGKRGCFFNPLLTAEKYDALDRGNSEKDKSGYLHSLKFYESRLSDAPIFKAAFDCHVGIFCTDRLASFIQKNKLEGVSFREELECIHPPDPCENIFGEETH